MSNFLVCVNAVLPLIVMMGTGFFLNRRNVLPSSVVPPLNTFCTTVLLPVSLFLNAANADFSTDFDPAALAFMLSVLVGTALLCCLLVPKFVKDPEDTAVIIQALTHGNTLILGLPVMQNLYGAGNTAAYSLLVAFFSPLANPLMIGQRLHFCKKTTDVRLLLRSVFSTPLLWGTLLGMAVNFAGITLPRFLQTSLTWLNNSCTPVSLIALGASFTLDRLGEDMKKVLPVFALRCILLPAVISSLAMALGFTGKTLAGLLVVFAAPCSTSTFSYCSVYGGNARLASRTVFFLTACSMFTIFGWIWLFLQLGLI